MPAKDKINLLPKDEFETSSVGKFVQWAVHVGRWIVVLTEFIVICAFLSRFYFDTKLANLFDDIKQKQSIVDSALSFEDNFRQVQDKIKIIKGLIAEEKKPSITLVEVSQSLPLDVTLTGINIDNGSLGLSGYSLSERGLNVLLSGLVTNPHLEAVSLDNISSQKDNPSTVGFTISAKVK